MGKDGVRNVKRDSRPVAEIRERTTRQMSDIRDQLRATNARVGREVCHLVSVGTGVVRMRELNAEGKLPGFEHPSQLFSGGIGHGSPAIGHLCTYTFYAAVLQRDPQPLGAVISSYRRRALLTSAH